jgi:hypothetical protein
MYERNETKKRARPDADEESEGDDFCTLQLEVIQQLRELNGEMRIELMFCVERY